MLMNEIALSIDLGANFIRASMAMYKRVDLKTSMKIFKPAARVHDFIWLCVAKRKVRWKCQHPIIMSTF